MLKRNLWSWMLFQPRGIWRGLSIIFLACLIGFGSALMYQIFSDRHLIDPDRYYHFKISQIYAEQGLPEVIPQAEDVGWGKVFREKEFFFHVLTGFAHWLNGEAGVVLFSLLLFCVTMLSLSFGTFAIGHSIFFSFFLVPLLVFCSHTFYIRLMLLRPHVLALLCYFWMMIALIKNRFIAFLILTSLYLMSYHAFYVPALLLGAFALIRFILGEKALSRQQLFVWLLVYIASLTLNPYFPTNIELGISHLKIALRSTSIPINFFGNELLPMRIDVMFRATGVIIIATAALVIFNVLMKLRWPKYFSFSAKQGSYIFAASLCFFWGACTFLSPRGFELFVPSMFCLLAIMVSSGQVMRCMVFVFVGILAVVKYPSFHKKFNQELGSTEGKEYVDDFAAALSALPEQPAAKNKVFNCIWSNAPYLFYFKPQYRFVDLLDPSFLHVENESKSLLKMGMLEDALPDLFYHIKNDFRADYVFCADPSVNKRLLADPNFMLRYPLRKDFSEQSVALFEPVAVSHPQFVQSLLWSIDGSQKESVSISAHDLDKNFEHKSRYFYFGSISRLMSNNNDLMNAKACLVATVTEHEMQRLEGAQVIGVGAKGNVKVWLNGELYYKNEIPWNPRVINTFISLEKKLTKSDKVAVTLCNEKDDVTAGLSLSLWKEADLAETCGTEEKSARKIKDSKAPYSDIQSTACTNPIVP